MFLVSRKYDNTAEFKQFTKQLQTNETIIFDKMPDCDAQDNHKTDSPTESVKARAYFLDKARIE